MPWGILQSMENIEISKGDYKRERVERASRRATTRKVIIAAVSVGAIGLLVWGGIIWGRRVTNAPGMSFANQGQEHVALDYQFSYNSNPPSSGPHYKDPANWGIYDYEVHDKLAIHNMEHGGIWISYRPSVDMYVVEHLKAIVGEFGGSKIVMAPRQANDADVAVAAWARVLKIDLGGGDITEDQLGQIKTFYKAYKNRGPELVPDAMPGIDPKSVQ